MTNLLAAIFVTVTTNWTDVARITPIVPPGETFYALYLECSTVQRGTVITNTVARINYEGRDVDVVLKTEARNGTIERTIGDLARGGYAFPCPNLKTFSTLQITTNGLILNGTVTNNMIFN